MNTSQFDHFFLENGMEVVLYPMDSVRSFSLQIGLKAGSALESTNSRGSFHFLEHIVLNNCQMYKGNEGIHMQAEKLGLSYNAGVNHLQTQFWFKGPEKTTEDALLFAQTLLRYPRFEEKNIETIKRIILTEYEDYWNQQNSNYAKECDLFFYGNKNPYIHDSLGERNIIESLTKKKLQDLYERYYRPQNIKLSLAGNFDQRGIKKLILELFGNWERTSKIIEYPHAVHMKNRKNPVLVFDNPQSQIPFTLSFPIPGYLEVDTKMQFRQRLASYLLGEARTSVLNKEIREKRGYSYSIWSDIYRWPYTGSAIISASVNVENIKKCIEEISSLLQKVRKEGFDEVDMLRGRNYKNLRLYLGFSSPEDISGWLYNCMIEDEAILLPEEYERIANTITYEEVMETFQEIFNLKESALMMKGDKEAIEKSGVIDAFKKYREF
jgi:predicted Zn-dependent peptidase